MKKTYIMPEALTVELGTTQMMAQSLVIHKTTGEDDEDVIDDPSQILTKENKNLWDEEW